MPLYIYYCNTCKVHIQQFEISPRFKKDDSEMRCEVCGNTPERIFNPPTIMYKGTGFYTTDHPKENK
jgi:putative FmdB family regulatory protein